MKTSILSKLVCSELERQLSTRNCVARPPAGSELLWRWFTELNLGRTFGVAGPNPLQYAEIEAYARISRWPIEAHHVSIIMAMDSTYLEFHARRQNTADGVKSLPPISTVPLSAGMLDAMFG